MGSAPMLIPLQDSSRPALGRLYDCFIETVWFYDVHGVIGAALVSWALVLLLRYLSFIGTRHGVVHGPWSLNWFPVRIGLE